MCPDGLDSDPASTAETSTPSAGFVPTSAAREIVRGDDQSGEVQPTRPTTWGPYREIIAWGVFLAVFLAIAVIPAFTSLEPSAMQGSLRVFATPLGAAFLAILQLFPIGIAYWLARRTGRTASELGVNRGAGIAEVALGVAAYCAFALVFPVVATPLFRILPARQIPLPELAGSQEVASWGVFALSVGVMEEWVLRGYAYGVLAAHLKRPWVSAAIISALFGFAHLYQGWGPVVVLTLFGFYLNALRIWRGSLVAPVIVHVLNDFMVPLLVRHVN